MRNGPFTGQVKWTGDHWTWRVMDKGGRVVTEPDPNDPADQYVGPTGELFAVERARSEARKQMDWRNV